MSDIMCNGCHKYIKDLDTLVYARSSEDDHISFHAGCLRGKISAETLLTVQKEAKERTARLLSDWRLVVGAWMQRGGYPYRQSLICPVCEGYLDRKDILPLLKHDIWAYEKITVVAYHCPVCYYFLPQIPDEGIEKDEPFDKQWETIVKVFEE